MLVIVFISAAEKEGLGSIHVMMYGMMSPKGYEITFNGYYKEDLKKIVLFLNNHGI